MSRRLLASASVSAPMAAAATSAPVEAQLPLPKVPKMEEAAVSVPREGGATGRPASAMDTHFHLDRLARAVRRSEEQGKSPSLASVLADVFRPGTSPIHAMKLQYAVASFCDLEFHVCLDRDPQRDRRLEDLLNDPCLGVWPNSANALTRAPTDFDG